MQHVFIHIAFIWDDEPNNYPVPEVRYKQSVNYCILIYCRI